MVWGAFTGFDKSPLIFLPQGEWIVADFVKNVDDVTLSAFYFMHDAPSKLVLMEDGALMHRGKLPQLWRQAHRMQKLCWETKESARNGYNHSSRVG